MSHVHANWDIVNLRHDQIAVVKTSMIFEFLEGPSEFAIRILRAT